MSVSGDILTDVLSKLGVALGSSFSELPDLFETDNLSARSLENGYSAILTEGANDENQATGNITINRLLTIKISYRTYTRPNGSKTKTVLQTLYTNEETLINHFLKYPSKPTGLIGMVDPVTTNVETLNGEDDIFLIHTLTFNTVYRFAYT